MASTVMRHPERPTMRILLYGLNFTPEPVGIGKYTGEMARWLTARGHQVKVVCAPPYYPDWRVADGYSPYAYHRETIDGAEVLRCPIWVPRRVTGARRVLHLLSFALSSLLPMLLQRRWRPDVVFAVEPPLLGAVPALLCARLCGARSWLHVQDFEVDAAFDLGLLNFAPLRHLAYGIERLIMRRFDRVSTISEKMVERALKKTGGETQCELFPNWVDTKQIYPLAEPSPYRAELGIPDDAIVLLYSGSMGEKQGLDIILDTARALLAEPRYRFVMAGSGSGFRALRDAAAGIDNMQWLPLQPAERLNAFLNLADVHLLPQRADAADLVMPSKLTGMLASGRPVIATAHPDTQVGVVVRRAGLVVPPGSVSELRDAIEHLGNNAELRTQLGHSARAYACDVLERESLLKGFELELLSALAAPTDAVADTVA
ncbi:MAG: glycosyltransferase WbuB [Thiohalocapsa sp.]|uniref:glycosyltransferase WbuB n=1 Tax=Thiohalocapsa sp. TaxID=2497641 RepID=UPI0025EA3E0F|nr:glycosyltransferase WbuB [Thiohalocapsa sp.]MCG6942339.1 glycosyltransferase WbuB [Thiohalocapsa sp.]